MSLLLSKFFIGIIMATAGFYICKNLLCYKDKLNIIEVVIAILIVALPTIVFYEVKYNALVPLFTFIISIFVYKRLFKETLTTALLLASFIMLLTSCTDIIFSSILIFFISFEELRETWYVMIACNLVVGSLAVLLAKWRTLQIFFQRLARKLEKKVYISTILFLFLFLGTTILIFYNITSIFKFNAPYIITLMTMLIVFILYIIYMMEKVQYDKLSNEYQSLFDCIQTFEIWIDKEQFSLHEMKNSLAVIRGLTKNKKIHNKIDEILNENIIIEKEWAEQLKNIPKGGIKGLLYYKMAMAKKKKVSLYVEVSPKIMTKIKKLTEDQMKRICILLGIYLDNAIDASMGTKKAEVTLEIYATKDTVQFVISNSFKQKPDLEVMNKKGYTTKGEGHGNGLYFAQKILHKKKDFTDSRQILNDYYIQRLTVHFSKKQDKLK